MLREIKFRGLTKKEGWVYGDLVHKKGIKYPIINFYTHDGFQYCYEVAPKTVGEYTGLHDCKRTEQYPEGQELYEGDIVKSRNGYLHVVTYGEYMSGVLEDWAKFEFVAFKPKILGFYFVGISKENKDHIAFIPTAKQGFEIIGNIHDNPELMKESEDNEM